MAWEGVSEREREMRLGIVDNCVLPGDGYMCIMDMHLKTCRRRLIFLPGMFQGFSYVVACATIATVVTKRFR